MLTVNPLEIVATVAISGNWVVYTPPSGFTNSDAFSYTVTDSDNASASAWITVNVAQINNGVGQNLSISAGQNGSVVINGDGVPDYVYHVQYSDVASPFVWQALGNGTSTANSFGQFQITDTNGGPSRFYRSVYP